MNRYRVSKKANAVSTKSKPNKDMSLLDEVPDEPRQQNIFGASMPEPKEPAKKPKTWDAQSAKKVRKPEPPKSDQGDLFG
ncbi:hypothetical protein D3C71_2076560 [compost metagenome]